jgi:hypothetical protein
MTTRNTYNTRYHNSNKTLDIEPEAAATTEQQARTHTLDAHERRYLAAVVCGDDVVGGESKREHIRIRLNDATRDVHLLHRHSHGVLVLRHKE